MNITKTTKKRFWDKVGSDEWSSNECWEWKASLNRKGYGQFRIEGKVYKAHRVSWVIHFGDIPLETLVLHKCDNSKCVNPEHLFLGTHMDNRIDAINKGRARISTLYEGEAWLIRKLWDSEKLSFSEIGKMFKCSRYTIGNIIAGRVKNFRKVLKPNIFKDLIQGLEGE